MYYLFFTFFFQCFEEISDFKFMVFHRLNKFKHCHYESFNLILGDFQVPQSFLINLTFTHTCISLLEFSLVLTDLHYYIKITRNPLDFFFFESLGNVPRIHRI